MEKAELLAQIDEQNRIIREQKEQIVFLQEQNNKLDDMYCFKLCREERLRKQIESLQYDIERLRQIKEESKLIQELREKNKSVKK